MQDAYTSWNSVGGNNADHIGGNGYEFAYIDAEGKKQSLQVDYGSQFCNKNETGYDSFIPVVPESNDILITHGHADHIGGIAHLMNIQRKELTEKRAKGENLTVHCTAFAEKMIKNNLQSIGIPKEEYPEFNVIEADKPFEVNGFKIEPFAVSHSIPDSIGFVIESPDGTRMMTLGDFKTAPVPVGKGFQEDVFAAVAGKGVDYLFLDSTSASSKGETIGEADVKKGLREILKQSQEGPVISGVISSSCHRLHTIASALAEEAIEFAESYEKKTGTKVVPKPRTMILDGASLIAARRALNACDYNLETLIKNETGVDITIVASNTKTALQTPPEERFYVCTGTQGEEASLRKIAEGRNKNVSLAEMKESSQRDDLPIFVYNLQSCIPGSEAKHQNLENKFQEVGCTTYFPSRYKENKYTVHASGHAGEGDIARVCRVVGEKSPRPTMVVPIHGDPKQRRTVMKIAQDNNLKACIVPNMAEMRAYETYSTWTEGGRKEEWIGVNDVHNDFRRPYFKYDRLELDVESKKHEKVGEYKYFLPKREKKTEKKSETKLSETVDKKPPKKDASVFQKIFLAKKGLGK